MNKSPCKECLNRTLTCHGVCEEYQNFAKERVKSNDYNRKKNEMLISESGKRAIWRHMRGRKGRHRTIDSKEG